MAKCFIKTFHGNYWETLSVAASNSPTHNPVPPLDFAPQSRLCEDPIIGEGDRDKRWRGVAVGVCLIVVTNAPQHKQKAPSHDEAFIIFIIYANPSYT